MANGQVAKAELEAELTADDAPHNDAHTFGTYGIPCEIPQAKAGKPCSSFSRLASLYRFVFYFGHGGVDESGMCSCQTRLLDLNAAGKHLLTALNGCHRGLTCTPKTNREAAELLRVQEALAEKQLERATEESLALKEEVNALALVLTQRLADLKRPACSGERGVAQCFVSRNTSCGSTFGSSLTWGDISSKHKTLCQQIRLMEVCSSVSCVLFEYVD